MRKTIMIFGASSFLGSNLFDLLKDDYRIIGTYHNTPIKLPNTLTVQCDVLDKRAVNKLIAAVKPDITIYCVGLRKATAAHLNPDLADALNTSGMVNVCTSSERFGSKFVYLSSHFVLSGEDISFKVGDIPFPGTKLGQSLAASEFYIQRSCLNYLIFRCCNIYGRSYHPMNLNWFEVLQKKFLKGQNFAVDDHVKSGFLDVNQIGKIIKMAISENVTNRLFQISSNDILTHYEFAKLYAKYFKQDQGLIAKGIWELPQDENLSLNISKEIYTFRMDISTSESSLNLRFPTIEESIESTFKRLSA